VNCQATETEFNVLNYTFQQCVFRFNCGEFQMILISGESIRANHGLNWYGHFPYEWI